MGDTTITPEVLVIDDEHGTRESPHFAMQREYEVLPAASVEEGWTSLGRESLDTMWCAFLRLSDERYRNARAAVPPVAAARQTAEGRRNWRCLTN